MTKPDLSGLSVKQLEELIQDAQAALAAKREQKVATLAEEFRKKAEAAGLDVKDVLANLTAKKKRPPVKPKYRHPSDAKLTWSGRGRTPRWMAELLEKGKSRESLEIR